MPPFEGRLSNAEIESVIAFFQNATHGGLVPVSIEERVRAVGEVPGDRTLASDRDEVSGSGRFR